MQNESNSKIYRFINTSHIKLLSLFIRDERTHTCIPRTEPVVTVRTHSSSDIMT